MTLYRREIPYLNRRHVDRPASLREKLTDRGWVECGECGGDGFVVEERIRTVAEHHPNCDGITCESTCPVPVPVPEYEREHCPADCVEGLVPPEGMVEAAAEALVIADSSDLLSSGNPWWNLREPDRNEARRVTRAALLAAARWERER